nr:MAG TPA: hypothetical protein [Caudoviricetes sp.]
MADAQQRRTEHSQGLGTRHSGRATAQPRQTGRLTSKSDTRRLISRRTQRSTPWNTTEHTMERNGAHQGTGRGAPWNGAHQRDDGAHHETERQERRQHERDGHGGESESDKGL